MSTEENKRIAQRFFGFLNNRAFDDAFALLARDATWWVPTDKPGGMTMPKDAMRNGVESFFAVFAQPPIFQIHRMTAEEDRVCVEQTSSNGRTHHGVAYANDYHLLLRFREGLIVEVREYMNPLLAAGVVAELGGAKQ